MIKRLDDDFMNGDYPEDEFFAKMRQEHGDEAVTTFIIKRESLRQLLDREGNYR
jgi:hypothetical protein